MIIVTQVWMDILQESDYRVSMAEDEPPGEPAPPAPPAPPPPPAPPAPPPPPPFPDHDDENVMHNQ